MEYAMNTILKSAIAAGALAFASQAAAQITFYEREDFQGRAFTTQAPVEYLGDYGFNDRASSIIVTSRRWEICEDPRFGGRCEPVRALPSSAARRQRPRRAPR